MDYLFYMRLVVLSVAMLLSKLVFAWPVDFEKYFDVTNNQGENLVISKKPYNAYLSNMPVWANVLWNDIADNGSLMIVYSDHRSFIVRRTEKSMDSNYNNQSFIFYLPAYYPSIYMPGDKRLFDEIEKRKEDNMACGVVDISNIFSKDALVEIPRVFTLFNYYLQEGVIDEYDKQLTLSLAQQEDASVFTAAGKLMTSQKVIVGGYDQESDLTMQQDQQGSEAGVLMQECYECWYMQFTKCILLPVALTMAICVKLIYERKSRKNKVG